MGFWDSLGGVVGSVGTAYVQSRYAPSPAAYAPSGIVPISATSPPPSVNQRLFGVADQPAIVQGAVMATNGNGGCCPPPGDCGPKYGRYCYATQTVTPMRRRRKKNLVSAGDLQGLAAIKAIVGGGAALNAAVIKALR